ncbi:MAG: hypothetical protein GX561_02340 [Lentisphaerae bacterium]|jgi:hypothetical protein|nr:hypothetical protein [Lentisphaerota bacterium]
MKKRALLYNLFVELQFYHARFPEVMPVETGQTIISNKLLSPFDLTMTHYEIFAKQHRKQDKQ